MSSRSVHYTSVLHTLEIDCWCDIYGKDDFQLFQHPIVDLHCLVEVNLMTLLLVHKCYREQSLSTGKSLL